MKTKMIVVIFSGFVASAVFGQESDDVAEFREFYRLNYPKLLEKYSANKEIVANITAFNEFDDDGGKTGAKNTIHRVRIVSDGVQSRLFFEKSTDGEFDGTYRYKLKNSVFVVGRNRLSGWTIKDLKWKSRNPLDYESSGYLEAIRIPSCAQSFRFELIHWLNSAPRPNQAAIHPEILGVSEEEYRGMNVVKVHGRLKALQLDKSLIDYRCDFYLDPKDFYSTVGFSTEFHKAMGSTVPRKTVMEIDYFKEKGVNKYPKKYTEFAEFRDGLRVRRIEIDFVELRDYVPAPEDFTLEKMFGLTTPDPSQEDQGSSMGGLVFWVIVAGVLVLVIVFLLLRKKVAKPKIN